MWGPKDDGYPMFDLELEKMKSISQSFYIVPHDYEIRHGSPRSG